MAMDAALERSGRTHDRFCARDERVCGEVVSSLRELRERAQPPTIRPPRVLQV